MSMVSYEAHGHIAEIALDHPPVNALTGSMIDELLSGFERAAADPLVRAVILRSNVARRFCAGLDLGAVALGTGGDLRALIEKLYVGLLDAQRALGKPSIAVVSGAARGGGMTLAISCDLILAGDSATFGYPEIDVGLIPAIHYAHLPAIVGRYRAFDLLFSGRVFSAEEAAALGLVSQVVSDEELLDHALEIARSLSAKPPSAMRLGRAAFKRVNETHYRANVIAAVDDFCAVAGSEEARECALAYMEKR